MEAQKEKMGMAEGRDLFSGSSRRPFEAGRTPFDGLRAWAAMTHGVGIFLALLGTIFLLLKACRVHFGVQAVGGIVFSVTLIALYIASTLYHSVRTGVRGRIVLRKLDHTAVFFLIAGTYTPLCLTLLKGTFGTILLCILWILAIAGTFMAFLWINAPRKLNAAIYIGMGWLSVTALPFIYRAAGLTPIIWLVVGGLLYTIGGGMYAFKWPRRHHPKFGCHEIFHVFIVFGSIAHYGFVYHCLGS